MMQACHLRSPGPLEEMVVVTVLEAGALGGPQTQLELHDVGPALLEPDAVVQLLPAGHDR